MALGLKITGALAALAVVLAIGLGGQWSQAPAENPPAPAGEIDARAAKASTQFGIGLLKQVYAGENTFLSPASASLVLSLTANGARGETQQAMLQTLGFGAMTMAEVNQANAALQTIAANPDPEVQVAMANAIWHEQGLTPAAAFINQAGAHYQAEVQGVTFGTDAATKAINDWVSKQTRTRIPTLLDKTTGDEVMILANAIWFKGLWSEPFDPDLTEDRPFTRPDGTVKQVPMMHQTGRWSYLEKDGLQGVRIPYGEGRMSLYVLLPARWDGFIDSLTPEQFDSLLAGFSQAQGNVALPKLKLEYQTGLVKPLTAMGMGPALGPGADFSGLFEGGAAPTIGAVIQKTFLEMTEEGTEAAAATGVVMVTSAPADPPFQMIIDHPYLLAIRDDQTGVLLFVGAIVDP